MLLMLGVLDQLRLLAHAVVWTHAHRSPNNSVSNSPSLGGVSDETFSNLKVPALYFFLHSYKVTVETGEFCVVCLVAEKKSFPLMKSRVQKWVLIVCQRVLRGVITGNLVATSGSRSARLLESISFTTCEVPIFTRLILALYIYSATEQLFPREACSWSIFGRLLFFFIF